MGVRFIGQGVWNEARDMVWTSPNFCMSVFYMRRYTYNYTLVPQVFEECVFYIRVNIL